VTPLERNRVGITFSIVEGRVAKIKEINLIGNEVFDEETLLDEFSLSTSGLMTWYTDSDQYSRPKLQGDLEALRSFYLNRGYIEFTIDSTQVSISPNAGVDITEQGEDFYHCKHDRRATVHGQGYFPGRGSGSTARRAGGVDQG
jgi:outer membrane protein insertion porin family